MRVTDAEGTCRLPWRLLGLAPESIRDPYWSTAASRIAADGFWELTH